MLQAALSLNYWPVSWKSPVALPLHGLPLLPFPGHPKTITQGQILCMGPAFKKLIKLQGKL